MKIRRVIEFEVPNTPAGVSRLQGQMRYSCPDGTYHLFNSLLVMTVRTEDSLVATANHLIAGEKWAGPKPLPYSAPVQEQKENNGHVI